MYSMTECMPMSSRLLPIRYGGTGVSHGEHSDLVSVGVSDILGIIILGTAVSPPTGTVVTMPAIGVVTGEAIGAVIGVPDGIRITDIGLLETGDTPIYVRDAIRLHTVELPVLL